MKRPGLAAVVLMLGLCVQAHAIGGLADVSLVDRETGSTLTAHYHRGECWVAGTPGARYAIEIRNRVGGRLLAVTSVDGVNVVSGATAGWDQTGYVFGAGQSYQITGWRKSDADVAAFSFTASPNSYAERTGRPANVGVIGVALFRERLPQPEPQLSQRGESRRDEGSGANRAAPAAPAAPAASAAQAADSSGRVLPGYSEQSPKLGTGHGPHESSFVSRTEFEREQSQPNEIIRIRYDSMENLMAMGVVPRGRPLPVAPNAFPGTQDHAYVPDPPG